MFVAYVKQAGEGCDYTIACGETMWTLDAKTREDAVIELERKVVGSRDEYGCVSLSKLILFEVLSEEEMPLSVWYRHMKEAEEQHEHEQAESRERREFERLRKKYSET